MVQLQNFFFFITSMVVPRGTTAPVLLKRFVSRDVLTGALSSNGTIIPIPIPEFFFWSIYIPGNSYAPWTEQKWGVGQSKLPAYITSYQTKFGEAHPQEMLFFVLFPLLISFLSNPWGLVIFIIFLRSALFTILSYSLLFTTR